MKGKGLFLHTHAEKKKVKNGGVKSKKEKVKRRGRPVHSLSLYSDRPAYDSNPLARQSMPVMGSPNPADTSAMTAGSW